MPGHGDFASNCYCYLSSALSFDQTSLFPQELGAWIQGVKGNSISPSVMMYGGSESFATYTLEKMCQSGNITLCDEEYRHLP